ncbi:acyltransferase family protein [Epilithonimonas zeae]|uniref:acyltransferase family protein n=1 Tax=Epilithonimonas zeae TaxID=1416779 RepID=UPI00200CEB0E|nr:acyltransferase family protein [Epilithonimonas zeae]UQB67451.1 acyltransferase [Epilithonimonas zeae]
MHFRSDISFLRAISVLIVMFFHFQINGFSGGFIGVDVFFVISGFLMTQITLKGFENDKFSLKDFYIKRAKRIFPALLIMLCFVLLISIFLFLKADLKLNAKYVLLANFFSSNLYFWKYQNYFSSGDNILLHTWSLGLEWQFYLIYPLLLLLLRKTFLTKEKLFWIIMAIITIASFFIMLLFYKEDNNFTFYMLPSRFWELSIGGLALGFSRVFKCNQVFRKWVTYISIITILLSCFFISESIIWPSYYTIIPVLATTFVLYSDINSILFNNKITKLLGDISYSLYLWHWPWFVLFKYFGFISGGSIFLLIILSILSALLSYYFIEKNKLFANGRLIIFLTVVITLSSGFIFSKPDKLKFLSLYENRKFEIANYSKDYEKFREKQFNPCGCYVTNNDKISKYNIKKCQAFSTEKKNIFLIGDSHMAHFSSAFRKEQRYNWLELSLGYMLPIPVENGKKERRALQNDFFNKMIKNNHSKIDIVIISAHWMMRHNPNINLSEDEMLTGIKSLITNLEYHHVKYLFIGQSETYKLDFPKVQMLEELGRRNNEFLSDEAYDINKKLKTIIPKENYVDIYNVPLIIKSNNSENQVYMFDSNHYSNYGAEQCVQKIIMPRIHQIIK